MRQGKQCLMRTMSQLSRAEGASSTDALLEAKTLCLVFAPAVIHAAWQRIQPFLPAVWRHYPRHVPLNPISRFMVLYRVQIPLQVTPRGGGKFKKHEAACVVSSSM